METRERAQNEEKNTCKHLLINDVPLKNPDGSTSPKKGKYRNAYCIFESARGHGYAFCLNNEFDFKTKLQKAKLHKVYLVCISVTNHKEKGCTKQNVKLSLLW